MKLPEFIIRLIALLFFALPLNLLGQDGFALRGYDLGRTSGLTTAIEDAAANGMNFITLSHDVCMEWYEVGAGFEDLAQNAGGLGLEIYFWNHVISKPPAEFVIAGRLNLDDPGLWKWLYSVYIEMLEKVPSMTGIVLSFTEADYQIYRSSFEPEQSQAKITTTQSPVELIERTILTVYNALKTKNKKLIVRDFWRTNTEHFFLWEALQNCPADIMVYTKHVCNDFRYAYPVCLSLGQYPGRIQILEFESSKADPEYYQEVMQNALEEGIQGVCPRIRVGSSYNRNFFNLCYKKILAHDPYGDLTPLWDSTYYDSRDRRAMSHYIECLRSSSFAWDSYLGKDLKIQDKRLYKGESRPLYTHDSITNLNDRKIRGLEGIEYADSALLEFQQSELDCKKWSDSASHRLIKEEFDDLAKYACTV